VANLGIRCFHGRPLPLVTHAKPVERRLVGFTDLAAAAWRRPSGCSAASR
jgi:hypothetical protein